MIDFCIAVSAPNVDVLFRLFMGSLKRHSNLSNVGFRIMDRGCNEAGWTEIRKQLKGYEYTTHGIPGKLLDHNGGSVDAGDTCDWMMNRCGCAQWVVISHFDIVFKKDFLGEMIKHTAINVGMIGQHCAMMMLNREAYKQSRVKFMSTGGLVAQPVLDMYDGTWIRRDEYRVRMAGDERVKPGDGSVPIRGFDTGDLLELDLRSLGWKVHPLTVWKEEGDHHEWYDHLGGGGSVWDEPAVSEHRQRALRLIEEGGY